jgi:hypothetical protein
MEVPLCGSSVLLQRQVLSTVVKGLIGGKCWRNGQIEARSDITTEENAAR